MLVNGVSGNLISIRDRGFLYGDGVFRTLRVSGGSAQHWPLHFQKLQHDCNALGIGCPDFGLLSAELDGLREQHPDGVYRLVVTRGQGVRGYAPPQPALPVHLWDVLPVPVYPAAWTDRGIAAMLCELRLGSQLRLAGIKHLNRLENVLAAAELTEKYPAGDVAEGLLRDGQGRVISGTRSNLFLVVQGSLVTPDLSRCGVAGVQRGRVMDWAAAQNMPLQVRDVAEDELWTADELFVVNSVFGLWSIGGLGQRSWSDFPVALRIRQALAKERD